MARLVLPAVLLAISGAVSAGFPSDNFTYRWEVFPAQPTTQDVVRIRNIVTACNPATNTDNIAVELNTGTIDVFLEQGSDVCSDRIYVDDIADSVVGYLPAGAYTVRLFSCPHPQDNPGIPCSALVVPNLSFVVADAGRPRRVIPAWSLAGAVVTLLILAGTGVVRLRSR